MKWLIAIVTYQQVVNYIPVSTDFIPEMAESNKRIPVLRENCIPESMNFVHATPPEIFIIITSPTVLRKDFVPVSTQEMHGRNRSLPMPSVPVSIDFI